MKLEISHLANPGLARYPVCDIPVKITLRKNELSRLIQILSQGRSKYDAITIITELNSFSTDPQLGLTLDILIPE